MIEDMKVCQIHYDPVEVWQEDWSTLRKLCSHLHNEVVEFILYVGHEESLGKYKTSGLSDEALAHIEEAIAKGYKYICFYSGE